MATSMAGSKNNQNPYEARLYGGISAAEPRPLAWLSRVCAATSAACLIIALVTPMILVQVGLFGRFGPAGDAAHLLLARFALGCTLFGFLAGIIAGVCGSRTVRIAMLILAVPYAPLVFMDVQWILSRFH